MADKIFIVSANGGLEPMTETPYEKELDLQNLLTDHSDLLPSEQIDPDFPRRWLLISDEVAVADSIDGAGRWSVDHLFLDQDGIPTIVETKRSSDTRLRREVVGQLLEYGANAVVHWPVAKLQADFARTCEKKNTMPDAALRSFLRSEEASDAMVAAFWERVKNNLSAERIRMILVADEIPTETRRIIEFLNGQMKDAEILAVELRQFKGTYGNALVPRLVGQTLKAVQTKKSNLPAKQWNEELILAGVEDESGPAAAAVAKGIMEWAISRGGVPRVTGGAQWGRFFAEFGDGNGAISPFCINSTDSVQYCFGDMTENVFHTPELQGELLRRVNTIPGNDFSPDKLAKYPWRKLESLLDPQALARFKEVFEWIFEQITKRAKD